MFSMNWSGSCPNRSGPIPSRFIPIRVEIAGEADQAAPLLKLLDSSPLFEKSEFVMSVTHTTEPDGPVPHQEHAPRPHREDHAVNLTPAIRRALPILGQPSWPLGIYCSSWLFPDTSAPAAAGGFALSSAQLRQRLALLRQTAAALPVREALLKQAGCRSGRSRTWHYPGGYRGRGASPNCSRPPARG